VIYAAFLQTSQWWHGKCNLVCISRENDAYCRQTNTPQTNMKDLTMFNFKTLSLAAFSVVSLGGLAGNAKADLYGHLDQLALEILAQSDAIVRESAHYRHAPEYAHLVYDARQIRALADHIHEVAHHRGSVFHLDNDLRQMDQRFHHLEEVVRNIERGAAYGHGHVHGNTAHVRRLLRAMENNIHHMQADVANIKRSIQRQNHDHYYGGGHGHGHAGHYDRGRGGQRGNSGHIHKNRGGLTVGNGKVRLNIKF
jgi:hypothetical protein